MFGAALAALLGRGPICSRAGPGQGSGLCPTVLGLVTVGEADGSSGVTAAPGWLLFVLQGSTQQALALVWLSTMAGLGTALSCCPVGLLVVLRPS